MTYTLRFLPEVEEDLINGYFWYAEKEKGLGNVLSGKCFLSFFYLSFTL